MRNQATRFLSSAALVIVAGACGQIAGAQQPSYQVRDLGTLGGRFTEAADINEAGQITGYSETADAQIHAFIYDGTQMLDLGALAASGSVGRALNDTGAVSGLTGAADGLGHAFRYDAAGMADLGIAGLSSAGNDINNIGDVAGETTSAEGLQRAVIFRSGTVVDLGTPVGVTSNAVSINDAGQVVGTYEDSAGSHAFVSTGAGATDLVPGRVSNVTGNQAINAAGQAVGSFQGGVSIGYAINGAGVVAGEATVAEGGSHAVVFANGSLVDLSASVQALSTLPVTSSSAFDINASGQVLGQFTVTDPADGSARTRAFIATPVTSLFEKLRSLATGAGPGQSLLDKIAEAQAAYAAQDVPGTCSVLGSFSNEVDAQSGKHLDPIAAAALLAEAAAIRAVLGCG